LIAFLSVISSTSDVPPAPPPPPAAPAPAPTPLPAPNWPPLL